MERQLRATGWFVHFNNGFAFNDVKVNALYVRGVRSGPTIADLIESVEGLGLRQPVERRLLAPLRRAQRRLDAGNTNRACRGLAVFTCRVRNQRRQKKIAAADAAKLLADARAVRGSLGCRVR